MGEEGELFSQQSEESDSIKDLRPARRYTTAPGRVWPSGPRPSSLHLPRLLDKTTPGPATTPCLSLQSQPMFTECAEAFLPQALLHSQRVFEVVSWA